MSTDKLGLALSGGGLRASFFHLGVLAQLAECGLLPRIETISAVSGGAIIAALYYVHLKRLLESKKDTEITDADYVDLVHTLNEQFRAATRKNIRLLALADLRANWRLYRRDYTLSDRIAEVYDQLLYRPALGRETPVTMRELRIFPPGQPDFHPYRDNDGRRHKVPVLILNATSLNTGRDWQFTARTMGEPVSYQNGRACFDEIDSVPVRLRRPFDYFQAADPRLRDFPLAKAVAASAAVPGVFPPVVIEGLYRDGEDPICVSLVDGGVHDNQGIDALLAEACTRFIVSDASGQLDFEPCPEPGRLGVLARSGSVLQDQVRYESLHRLIEVHGRDRVAFLHLRKGLGKREIAWINWNGKPYPKRASPPTTEAFGVAPEVQARLAEIRTDLDAFHDTEAFALMCDGYQIAHAEIAHRFGQNGSQPGAWPFLQIQPGLRAPSPRLLKLLRIGRHNVGKILLLDKRLLVPALGAPALTLAWAWISLRDWIAAASIPVSAIAGIAGLVILDWLGRRLGDAKAPEIAAFVRRFKRLARTPLNGYQNIRRFLLRAALPLAGAILVKGYLRWLNPLYLRCGRLR
ncbi:hypothetical protein MIN45_P2097 [Methylomarinovum tepidoasis]|uniref:PNPLA domain-containing protein n=1 Tax=Methylomarinovum tepidoasis TaxID=2840183 RepID=A0AAU9D444_9GAMM|nr:patatin-like phospholipase family protein [Methylomarinovum sp. IN45]BCX89724.1 hypothetical protein MIN45_P2097 [Methylomarinovum sp. IN45]